MFLLKLENIFTKENLLYSFENISKKSKGLDELSYIEFQKDLDKNIDEIIFSILNGYYVPEPLKHIEIKKPNSQDTRPIGLSTIKDKIIQKTIYEELNLYFDKMFSDKSYAYRHKKSPLKAINRVSDFIRRGDRWILKSDIDGFFENIDHNVLVKILDKHIKDKRIIKLLLLYLKIGAFKSNDYLEHFQGIHQGDIISPLLSNIYLSVMDQFLDKREINFVRFGDDFIVLTKSKRYLLQIQRNLISLLKVLKLTLKEEKTYICNVKENFVFLGVLFKNGIKSIDNDRFQKIISKIHSISKENKSFDKFIFDLDEYLRVLRNYYFKIIDKNSTQYKLFKSDLFNVISHKIAITKENKEITNKKVFLEKLELFKNITFFEFDDNILKAIIHKGYEDYFLKKEIKVDNLINQKKNKYSKKFATQSTIHINQFGVYVGVSKNKIVIKKYGKVIKEFPFSQVDRIIFDGKGFSISSDLIYRCANKKITIDFIDFKSNPYASFISYNGAISQNIHKQAMILNTDKHLFIAYQFVKGKIKNQLNYIKYLKKYHKQLSDNVVKMEDLYNKFKVLQNFDINRLMGYEGSMATIYWDSLKLILDIEFIGRITQGAKDIVNSSLNYGYAILYGKIQNSLVKAGVSLNISFLHSLDKQKPTLVFDMIEEFRSFVVDRIVISMINKDEPIKLDKSGFLTDKSKKLIAKNIYEKLGSYTMWRKKSIKIENIIQIQAYNLLKFIEEEKKYKPFIGKY